MRRENGRKPKSTRLAVFFALASAAIAVAFFASHEFGFAMLQGFVACAVIAVPIWLLKKLFSGYGG